MAADFLNSDIAIMTSFYDSLQYPPPGMDARMFLQCAVSRMHAESGNGGNPLVDWIERETHYELVRKRYQWDEARKCFMALSHSEYLTARNAVLKAAVRKGVELFERCLFSSDGDKLMSSLEHLI